MLGWNFEAGNEALFRSACDVESARLTRLQLEESSVTAGDRAAQDSPHSSTLCQPPPAAPCCLCPHPARSKIQLRAGGAACSHKTDSLPHKECQSVLWSPAPVCSSSAGESLSGVGEPEEHCPSKGLSPVFSFKLTDFSC